MTARFAVDGLPAVALFTAGSLGLLGVGLAVVVIVLRVRPGIEAGDGGNPRMTQAVRAHANFAEYAPLALLLLALLEISGTPIWIVVAVAALLLVGRLLSALGLSRSLGPSVPRQAGASATLLSILLAASGLVIMATDLH